MLQRGFDIGPGAAIEDMELLEIGQNGQGRAAIPAVANGLEVALLVGDIYARFFCFDEEFNVFVFGCKIKGVVGTFTAFAHGNAALDFDFLGIRISLVKMVDVPAEGGPEFIDKIKSGLPLLVVRGKIVLFIGGKLGS